MKVIILNAADEVEDPAFEGTPQEIAARVPEGGRYNEFIATPPEHSDDPDLGRPLRMLKMALFNPKGYPINVLNIDEGMSVDWIRGLPPGSTAVTLTDTPYEAVEMAGDLPALADMNLPEVTSGQPE